VGTGSRFHRVHRHDEFPHSVFLMPAPGNLESRAMLAYCRGCGRVRVLAAIFGGAHFLLADWPHSASGQNWPRSSVSSPWRCRVLPHCDALGIGELREITNAVKRRLRRAG